MRNFRARRRFKAILIVFIFIGFVLLAESRIDALVPQLKSFAEKKIESLCAGRIRISIGEVDGGILRPFVFDNIKIKGAGEDLFFPSLVINNIRTNYRIWDILLKRKFEGLGYNLLPEDSCIYINFSTNNNLISGFGILEGCLDKPKIKGRIHFLDSAKKIDFSGIIREDSLELELRPDSGILRARVTMPAPNELVVDFKSEHLRAYDFDVVCEGVLKNKAFLEESSGLRYFEGELKTKNLILNYKPFLDLDVSYKFSEGVLRLKDFRLGEIFRTSGTVEIKKPYSLDVTVFANNVSLTWLMSSLAGKEAGSVISGTMNGRFDISGPASNPVSEVHLDIRKGKISDLIDFDRLTATLKGEGPIIRIDESRITRQSGFFVLAGELDLGKAGKAAFFDGIKLVSDDQAITWDDWDTTKLPDMQEIRMKKKLIEDVNVDVKKRVYDDNISEKAGYKDEIRLEYKLQSNDSLKMGVGQDNDFFGFEHKNRF